MNKFLIYAYIFITSFFKLNIIKIVFLLTTISLFYVAYYTDVYNDVEVKYEVYGEFYKDGKYHYIYQNGKNNLKEVVYNEPKELKNNIIRSIESSETFSIIVTLAYFILIVSVIVYMVGYFSDDDDIKWNIKDPSRNAFCSLIRCEIQDGFYYYMVFNKLIAKSDIQLYYHNIDSFKKLISCPYFKPKRLIREDILKKLI